METLSTSLLQAPATLQGRRRRRRIVATVVTDKTTYDFTLKSNESLSRNTFQDHVTTIEQTFLHRTKGPKRGRAKKNVAASDEEVAAIRKAQLQEEAMRKELEQLKKANQFTFCIEDSTTYQHELDEERKRMGDMAAEKAHRRLKDAMRMVKRAKKKEDKKTKQNQDLMINEWVNASGLRTLSQINSGEVQHTQANVESEPLEELVSKTTTRSLRSKSSNSSLIVPNDNKENEPPIPPNKENDSFISPSILNEPSLYLNEENEPSASPVIVDESFVTFNKEYEPPNSFTPVAISPRRSGSHVVEKSWRSPGSNSTLSSTNTSARQQSFDDISLQENCFYFENYVGPNSPVDELLHVCNQERVLQFAEVNDTWTVKSKLGEGVYGEVYLVSMDGRDLAVKVIPFEGDDSQQSSIVFNGERLKSARSMIPEVVMTRELSSLRDNSDFRTDGFVELHRALVVEGEYPAELTSKWDEYSADRGTENDPPSVYSSPFQMYLLLSLGCAGHDLEHFELKDVNEASSIFTQVAFTLMVAENAIEFEHRDLHVGNILVSKDNVPAVIEYTYGGNSYRFASHGVKATVIDFTNSRMRKAATTVFVDLEFDPDLFSGTGDYQFDIYRMMRQHCNGQWCNFHHYNNLMWMHYLASKIFDTDRYPKQKRTFKKPASATRNMLSYASISDYIVSDEFAPLFELVDKN